MNQIFKKDFAMTGVIGLKGKVSAIGGVKEKILGAKQSGIKNIIFPEENREDVDDLCDFVCLLYTSPSPRD